MSFLPPSIRRRTTLIALSVGFGLLGFDASTAKAGVIFGFDGEVKAKSTTGRRPRPVEPSYVPPTETEAEIGGGGGETGDSASDLNIRRPQKGSGAGNAAGGGPAKRGGAGAPGGGAGAGGGGGSGSKSRSGSKPPSTDSKNNEAANGKGTTSEGDGTTTNEESETANGANLANGTAAVRPSDSQVGVSGSGDFAPGFSEGFGGGERSSLASGFPGASSFAGQGGFPGSRILGSPVSGPFDCPLPVDWLSCYPELTTPDGCVGDDPPPPVTPVVPEPSTALLMTLGLAAAGWRWRMAAPRI